MHTIPDAVVLTAPDGCTQYLARVVETSLRDMSPHAVLEVPCPTPDVRAALAEWCSSAGLRVLDSSEHSVTGRLLVENTPSRERSAA